MVSALFKQKQDGQAVFLVLREGGRRSGRVGLLEFWEDTGQRRRDVQPPGAELGMGALGEKAGQMRGSLRALQTRGSRTEPQALGPREQGTCSGGKLVPGSLQGTVLAQ